MSYDVHLLCLINLEYLFFNFWFCLVILTPLYFEFYSCFAFTCLSFFFWVYIYQGLHCMYLTCKEQECTSKTWISRPRLSIQACNTCFYYTSKFWLVLEMYLLKHFTCQIIPLKFLTLFWENGDFQLFVWSRETDSALSAFGSRVPSPAKHISDSLPEFILPCPGPVP